MTGSTSSSDGLDIRRRKLLFRSWHRGTREMDLIMGRFADSWIGRMNDSELDAYERLMEFPDGDLLAWVTGERPIPIPDGEGGAMLRRLRDFHFVDTPKR